MPGCQAPSRWRVACRERWDAKAPTGRKYPPALTALPEPGMHVPLVLHGARRVGEHPPLCGVGLGRLVEGEGVAEAVKGAAPEGALAD